MGVPSHRAGRALVTSRSPWRPAGWAPDHQGNSWTLARGRAMKEQKPNGHQSGGAPADGVTASVTFP